MKIVSTQYYEGGAKGGACFGSVVNVEVPILVHPVIIFFGIQWHIFDRLGSECNLVEYGDQQISFLITLLVDLDSRLNSNYN